MDHATPSRIDCVSHLGTHADNLFVIFPMGSGGNHLANLLSLSDRYKRRVDFTHYDNLSTTSAHFSDALNLTNLSDRIVELQNQSNVFCSHLAEYLWQQDFIKHNFMYRKFLMINIHNARPWVRHRIMQFNPALQNEYLWQETSTLYSQYSFSKLTGEHDFFNIDINTIFESEANHLIDLLEQMIMIRMNRDLACEAHQKWKTANYMSTSTRRPA